MPFSVLGRGGGCLLAAFVHRQGVKSREFVFPNWLSLERVATTAGAGDRRGAKRSGDGASYWYCGR